MHEGPADRYNAFITRKDFRRRDSGRLSSLRFGIKDNIDVEGMPTTAASRILRDNMPGKSASVVERLLNEGALISGKTNMHEFAIGATTTSTAAGPCLNPHDMNRICGGSSGGSAACVAGRLADVALGTDTGGSVRLPAALCGVIGFKPTTGAISAEGVIPLSTTLDAVGILGTDIDAVRVTFRTACESERAVREWSEPARRIRLGLFGFGDDEVSRELLAFAGRLSERFDISAAEIPQLSADGARVRRIVASYEGARYHSKWMKDRSAEYFPDVLSVLRFGSNITDEEHDRGLVELGAIRRAFEEKMKDFDALLTPTVTMVAPPVSEVLGHELDYRRMLANTELFNATGSPSISIPVASVEGMPCGLMISGEVDSDMKILDIAGILLQESRA